MAFKMKGSPMQRNFGLGSSPVKQPKSKILKLLKALKTGASFTPAGIVSLGIWEVGEYAVKNIYKDIAGAKSVPVEEILEKKKKSEESKIKKTKQIKKGDKIKATTLDY